MKIILDFTKCKLELAAIFMAMGFSTTGCAMEGAL
jgi:hypothetical protein